MCSSFYMFNFMSSAYRQNFAEFAYVRFLKSLVCWNLLLYTVIRQCGRTLPGDSVTGWVSVNVQCDTVKDLQCRCMENKFAHASQTLFFASLLPLLIRFYRLVFDIDIRSDWWSDFGRLQWSTLSLPSSSSILACNLHVNVLKRKEFLVAYDSFRDQRKRKWLFALPSHFSHSFPLGVHGNLKGDLLHPEEIIYTRSTQQRDDWFNTSFHLS
jgi:hypothetical protein